MIDIDAHLDWFAAYAAYKRTLEDGDATPIDLKLEHTYRVLENARKIVRGEDFPPFLQRACILAALYHDVARFDQYLRFRTFRDKESFDHGREAVKILKREHRLSNETAPIPHIVLAAVGLHNRFALPPQLPHQTQKACNVVRDADKLDILRIMDEHLAGPKPYNPTVVLRLPDDPDLCSPAVVNAVLEDRVAAYADLMSVNDFRLLLGTWFHEMHFVGSRQQFIQDKHAWHLLAALPDNNVYGKAKKHLLKQLGD